jgi:hypothetical protein
MSRPHGSAPLIAIAASLVAAACSTSPTALLGDAIVGPSPDAAAPFDADAFDAGTDQDTGDAPDMGLPESCSGLPETVCIETAGCKALYCDGCGEHLFVACALPTTGAPICPAICPACASATNEASCRSMSPTCHAVYRDPGTCDCATPGCCVQYDHCSMGQFGFCSLPKEVCSDAPACGGDFVPAYNPPGSALCWDGCVHQADCTWLK